MRQRQLVALTALYGTVALACWGATKLGGLGSSGIAIIATPAAAMASVPAVATSHFALPMGVNALAAVSVTDVLTTDPARTELALAPVAMSGAEAAMSGAEAAMSGAQAVISVPTAVPVAADPRASALLLADISAAEVSVVEAALPESLTPPEPRMRLASLFTSDPAIEYPKVAVRPVEIPNECLVAEICIDEYLWSLYQRTPKVDTNKLTERIKTTVMKKGKARTVVKTVTKYVLGDFTWKDPIAAQRAGMPLMDYVIGGMDRGFRQKLYHALRAMDDAGLMPGITSAFRDDYRQAIAVGNKAASDSSYHGGSRRGGYGRGLAVDLVSVRGETRMQRFASSEELWKWIDAHEKELGVGRPYRDRDPPHVGPIDGKEYAAKRGRASVQTAALQKKKVQEARLQAKKALEARAPAKKAQDTKPPAKNAQAVKPPAKNAQAGKLPAQNAPAAKPPAKNVPAVKLPARTAQAVKLETKKPQPGAPAATVRAKPAKSSKVSSLQIRASVQR
jgi:hypothetical protein